MTVPPLPPPNASPWRRLDAAAEALLYRLSVYAVPAVIGAVTLIALFAWPPEFPELRGQVVEFRVLEERAADPPWTPTEARMRLGAAVPVTHLDTKLSEAPFWLLFSPPQAAPGGLVELPSRHAREAHCWDAEALAPRGAVSRDTAVAPMREVRAGFGIDLPADQEARPLLCRLRFSGPARITVARWDSAEMELSAREFERRAGLLEGGLLVLAAFVFITALINREWLYVIFAAWLVASLRLGAISAGWDTHWLERGVPAVWMFELRKLTIAAYFLLTYVLFTRLFRDDLRRLGHDTVQAVARWSCPVLLAAAALLPFAQFLPVLWICTAVGAACLVFLLGRILFVNRSKVAIWYTASLAIVLAAGFVEVIAAALGFKFLVSMVNSVTAALSSALMAALAIAEQMREERAARMRAQEELRATYEAMPIGLFSLDAEGRVVRGNPALAQMLGGPGTRWQDRFEPGAWTRLREAVSNGRSAEMELRGAGEPERWFQVKATWANDLVEGSLQDVTERHRATQTLRFLAANDPLTGVLNRRGMEKALADAFGTLGPGDALCLAYVDLDRFKLINDLYGHVSGDEVLRQTCERMRGLVGEAPLARIGGDEFVVVLAMPPARAADVCRRIIEGIGGAHFRIGDKAFIVRCSAGVVELAPGTDVKDAISLADQACRAAKRRAHDSLVVYERNAPVFRERAHELRLIEQLASGRPPSGLFLVMQPIMSLAAPYDTLNFEMLVRMREPDGSIVSAGGIIPVAEANGHAAVIDRWILSSTLEWLERHDEQLSRTQFVCMNLSGASLNDERFAYDAFAMMARIPKATRRLCVEITESVALHDLDHTRRFIDRVRSLGARVALDDFGAGYTSFSYLKELPADALKIDGSFVTGIATHPANMAIVEAIVELARNLGMKSVAEWVEDRATLEALALVGIDHVQGYAIGKAQLPERILAATSSASFIEDERIASFVRELLLMGSGRRGGEDRLPHELH